MSEEMYPVKPGDRVMSPGGITVWQATEVGRARGLAGVRGGYFVRTVFAHDHSRPGKTFTIIPEHTPELVKVG